MQTTKPDVMELLMLLRRAIGILDTDRTAGDVLARFDAAVAVAEPTPAAFAGTSLTARLANELRHANDLLWASGISGPRTAGYKRRAELLAEAADALVADPDPTATQSVDVEAIELIDELVDRLDDVIHEWFREVDQLRHVNTTFFYSNQDAVDRGNAFLTKHGK